MAHLASGSVVRQIGSLFESGSATGLSDRQLLECFIARRDVASEAAFATMVSRHGLMVLGICRQLLGDPHHAEDAFQAVFLVLARRATSIQDPDLLGNWLYGVALRTARCAKHQLDRRRKKEEGDAMRRLGSGSSVVVELMVQTAEQPVIDREQAEALHREIGRLPSLFRLPVVLCYFEGLTLDEAARRLRCPAGTLRSRLARAREKLRRGLTRHGVVLPAGALAAGLYPRSASATISSPLREMTTRAAMNFVAGYAPAGAGSASAMVLAQEVLRSMLLYKLKSIALTFLFLGAIATSTGYWNHSMARKDDPVKNLPGQASRLATRSGHRNEDQRHEKAKAESTAPGRMIVTGRVLDPAGKPVKNAAIDLVARPRTAWVGASEGDETYTLLGQGTADGGGRFRLEALRTTSTRFFEVIALAAAPGFGLGWAELNADAEQPGPEIRLNPEQVVRVKLIDITGRPATASRSKSRVCGGQAPRGKPTESGLERTRRTRYEPGREWPSRTTRGSSSSPASAAISLSAYSFVTSATHGKISTSGRTTRQPPRKSRSHWNRPIVSKGAS
jgi:RNA polymerase sigma factor (sigma-70 family)